MNFKKIKTVIIGLLLSTVFFQNHGYAVGEINKSQISNKNEQPVGNLSKFSPLNGFSAFQWEMLLFRNGVGSEIQYPGIIKRSEWLSESLKKSKPCEGCRKAAQKGKTANRIIRMEENYTNNFKDDDDRIKVTKIKDGIEYDYYPVSRIVIHHTGEKPVRNKTRGIKYMKSLYTSHAINNGWGDVGYHYLIDMAGNVYEGSGGGKYSVGAHVFGHNLGSVGISLMSNGTYSKKQLESLEKLTVFLAQNYEINVTSKIQVRNNELDGTSAGWSIIGHKEIDGGKPIDPKINMSTFRNNIIKKMSE